MDNGDAYHGPMGKTTSVELPRAVRRFLWLTLGLVFGVGLGFALGLTKPRVRE
jgi:hypothetical protein